MHIPLEDWSQWTFSLLLLGGIFFVGLFNIVVYLVRRRLNVHYYFGMLCVFYVIWYSCHVMTFNLFSLDFLSDHYIIIIAAIATNRMALHITLYTMHTLEIDKPIFEKRFKIASNLLLLACFFMPFSITYTVGMIRLIELFNAIVQIYFSYEIIKVIKRFRKNIRMINVICYFVICIATIMQFIDMEFHGNTIILAFIMMALQAIILAMHYNNAIVEVERANVTLERKVIERTADLIQKEKETIHLISSISHDLRTPISVVGGYIGLLQSDPSIDETNKKYISNSLVRLSQMEKLTLDLFTLSQISDKNYTFELENIHIMRIMKEIKVLYTDHAKEKGITLEVNTVNAICIADKMRVLQILDNLLTNALTYARTSIKIEGRLHKDELQITVSDDGAGIQPKDLPHVFERFYKKSKHGSGLGLSNVKQLVQRMNGTVVVESELDVGTSFRFTLPLAIEGQEKRNLEFI